MTTKTEVKHTPIPWRLNESLGVVFDADNNEVRSDLVTKKLIVRAVNSHEELLDACKAALEVIRDAEMRFGHNELFDSPTKDISMTGHLERVIAKAEGK